jgi:hypothetical protein
MWVYSSSSQYGPKKKPRGEKIKERNGGNNKRNITAKKQTRTKRINIFFSSAFPFAIQTMKDFMSCDS